MTKQSEIQKQFIEKIDDIDKKNENLERSINRMKHF